MLAPGTATAAAAGGVVYHTDVVPEYRWNVSAAIRTFVSPLLGGGIADAIEEASDDGFGGVVVFVHWAIRWSSVDLLHCNTIYMF